MAIQNQKFLDAKQVNAGAESSSTLLKKSQTAPSLGALRDDDLLSQTKLVASQERRLTAQLLAHLREIERRRLLVRQLVCSYMTVACWLRLCHSPPKILSVALLRLWFLDSIDSSRSKIASSYMNILTA